MSKGSTSRVSYQNLRKASFLLDEMHRTGNLLSAKFQIGATRTGSRICSIASPFLDNANRTGILAGSTVKTARAPYAPFSLNWKHVAGNPLTHYFGRGQRTITHMATRYAGGLHSAIFSVRVFLLHLYENNFTLENLSLAVPEMVARRTVFREGFTGDETAYLLDEPNLATAFGKRDYAMMLLSAQTGLRACDVVNLKREDIDWRAGEIHIVQQKTGKPLSLPLEPESGNAIADYLLHARPKSDLPYIFLCHTGILRPITTAAPAPL
jgi:integrase